MMGLLLLLIILVHMTVRMLPALDILSDGAIMHVSICTHSHTNTNTNTNTYTLVRLYYNRTVQKLSCFLPWPCIILHYANELVRTIGQVKLKKYAHIIDSLDAYRIFMCLVF